MKNIKIKDNLNPPKKIKKKVRITSAEKKRRNENLKLVDIISKKKKTTTLKKRKTNKKIKNKDFDVESIKSDKIIKRKSIIDYQKERETKKFSGKNLIESSNNILIPTNKKNTIETNTEVKRPLKNKKINNNEKIILDDYELNHLNYDKAIELDKRGFCKTYWSIIKRDELLLFVFVSSKDFNLIYIKFARLIFTISTLMVMNAFLFSDESIHELFMNGVKYNFGQQALQIALSIIITHVLEILLCYLTMTDRVFYEIKAISKNEEKTKDIFKNLKSMKLKLIIFLVSSFIIMLFYWYFISAFCSVYNNTQVIYIIDCVFSFLFFMVDPLLIYAFFVLLRIISLKCSKGKKFKCGYITSRLFPIF